ncbi:MAG: WD40 repeat domain-containing serine/threonine protein kinase [Verrucomicrobiia bacterium]
MNAARICERCGAALLPRAPAGLCPKCLLGQAVKAPTQSAPASPPAAAPPARGLAEASTTPFGDYELIEEIARGGMGVVYKARQLSLNRIVALKMVLGGPLASPAVCQRFLDEAQTAAGLQHPNIIAIHEVGEHGGQPFFSMDYVEGRNLAEVLRGGPLPPQRAAGYAKTIAEAVAYAHQRGILHRDLKPSNVLIDQSNQPRITDFGLAKRLTGESDLTVSGQVLGSPNFMAPEQAQGRHQEVGPPSDVYSIGALLYHLLTGRPPFQAASLTEVLRQVVTIEPAAPRLLNPSLPRDLETVCLKCLEKEVPRRYQTARELAEELGRFLEGKPIQGRPVGAAGKAWKWCRRRPALAGMGAALVLTGVLGLAGVLWQWHQTRQLAQAEFRQRYAADMHLAQLALERNNRPLAISLLDKYRPSSSGLSTPNPQPSTDPRGWEWRYLWQLCQGDELLTLHRYSQPINALAVSKAGQVLAVATYNEVTLWDWPIKRPGSPLPIRGARSLSFSPTGNLLAVGTWNERDQPVVELWELDAGKAAKVLTREVGNHSLAISPDGRLLASFDSAGSFRIIDWASGQSLYEFQVPPIREDWAGVVVFSPHGRQLAVGEDLGRLRLLELRTGTFVTCPTPIAESINALTFSPASDLLAAGLGYGEGTIGLWDSRSGEPLGQLTNHTGYVTALAFTADGRQLLSASVDGTIRVWSVADRVELHRLETSGEGLRALAFLPDGQTLVSGGLKGSVCFWDATPRSQTAVYTNLAVWPGFESIRGLERPAFESATLDPKVLQRVGLAFTPNSGSFITMEERTGVLARWEWDARSWRPIETLPALGSNHWGVALSSDGHWLATGDFPGRVTLWDWTTRQAVTNFAVPIEFFGLLRFSHSDRYLLAATVRNNLKFSARLWRTGDWVEVPLQGAQLQGHWGVDLSPDDRLLAAGYASGAIKLFRFPSLEIEATLGSQKELGALVLFSPDGRWLVSTSTDGSARLWDVATRRLLASLRGHINWVWGPAFSPDGRRLATGGTSARDAVRLWDLGAHRELLSFQAEGKYFIGLAFSPDGNTLTAMSLSGNAHLWRAPSWAEIEAVEKRATAP